MSVIDENNLSVKRLEEMQNYLLALQKEKSDHLKLLVDHLTTINSLCVVLGVDYKQTIAEIDPTMDDYHVLKSTSKDMIVNYGGDIEIELVLGRKKEDMNSCMMAGRGSLSIRDRGYEFAILITHEMTALCIVVYQILLLFKDQRKLQGQLMVEQEALFGSIPSPSNSAKKNFRPSMGGLANKRLSLGGSMLQTPYAGKAAPSSRLSSSSKQQTLQSGRRESFLVPRKQQPCKVSNAPRTESAQRKKPLLNPPRTESTQTRKALSPLSALFSSNASTINIQNQNLKSGRLKETVSSNKTPIMTPTKIASAEGRLKETVSSNKTPIMTPTKMMASAVEGNITPKTLPIPMPVTPSTVSTAMTPTSRHVSVCADDIEYSFEERRAGYTYNPLSHTKVISKCLI
ncbi:hypothetical protein RND71_007381 [Anisodus tanguticus]|uniref:Uncharacterized protein n=1 Tax=Anisodus tanguticus TaxID=243964 RepID=A0AAE1SLI7_9SOLA|nr:hypothetical protein RND71_007381 [Anisodus tanguticus]